MIGECLAISSGNRYKDHMSPHAPRLTIDVAALAANWRTLAARAAPGECGAVVKANAYGIGIEVAVPALWNAGCRTFFVAHLNEAVRARQVAPHAAIYVLNGLPAFDRAYWEYGLAPVLGCLHDVDMWEAAQQDFIPHESDRIMHPALHVDTGMNRLGLRPADLPGIFADARVVQPDLVMSHFVSSEIPDDPINATQISAFRAVETKIHAIHGLSPKPRLSLCNSSGLFLPNAPRFDLARPGYALYGGNPTPHLPNPMQAVIRLEAPVVQINHVPKGARVGYNGNFVATRESRIATISCGYADGYPRNGGAKPDAPGGAAMIAGRECPFAGNVSMDLITLDITDLPEDAVKPGDYATLIGDGLDVDRVGKMGKTIGYEILTNLGQRHQRRVIGA